MYYILDTDTGSIVPIPFETVEDAEDFGINGGWHDFIIIKPIKKIKL